MLDLVGIYMRRNKFWLILLIIAIAAFGWFLIQQNAEDAAPSIFADQLCGELCWNDIQVGKTTKQELLEIIPTIPNLDENSVSTHEYSHPESIFEYRITFWFYRVPDDYKSEVSVIAEIRDDIVIILTFNGDLGLTFEEVINELSEPTIVASNYVHTGGLNTHFVNDVSGFSVTKYFKNKKSSVTQETEIHDLVLFYPDVYSMISEDFLVPDTSSILYSWNGFGKLEDLYWPAR